MLGGGFFVTAEEEFQLQCPVNVASEHDCFLKYLLGEVRFKTILAKRRNIGKVDFDGPAFDYWKDSYTCHP